MRERDGANWEFGGFWAMVAFTALSVALLCAGACVPQQAITQAQQNVEINRAHAADESLPAQAREIAQDNADAWEAQLYALDNDQEPSAGVRERSEDRAAEQE